MKGDYNLKIFHQKFILRDYEGWIALATGNLASLIHNPVQAGQASP